MAQQYFQYPQAKGALIPGQTILVNKYTIQVEKYLSQGGFADVYLVRTATPVYNTTHHVLKRIAVADHSMLAEVKKEVDIMRLLKGHPNIVHFIDAAWHKTANGMFEVFILMEYCPGGGILDMMNRRLRERLTEAEILQIFADVCEAVAYMHNLRPPLLHRDLKVENILQSSQMSYKLCDFGSATPVIKTPVNMQELRALEADLNKHTTMQYRAPEMIDIHMRRPINEKSDVWALGVLLYKLCYYTTPFEEHGPLAILQVAYRIPPYPVYSAQLNTLIGKMLKDHGTVRPSVFEILTEVHHMRGTKSQFQYNVPAPEPLSPSRLPYPKQPVPTVLDGVITYRSTRSPQRPQSNTSVPPVMNQGQLAREKVMEAIAPMRRGRPIPSRDSPRDLTPGSRPDSPQGGAHRPNLMGGKVNKVNLGEGNTAEDERAWKTWTPDTRHAIKPSTPNDDAWKIENDKENIQVNLPAASFNDNFVERLRMSVEIAPKGAASQKISGLPSPFSKESSIPIRSTPQAATGILPRKIPLHRNEKDAFDGLGLELPSERHEPTLGEARKLRTGLAIMSSPRPVRLEPESRPLASTKPPFLTPQSHLQTQAFLSTSPSTSSTGSATQGVSRSPSSIDGTPIESRFPSLEELDATLSATSSKSPRHPFSAKSTNVSSSVKHPNTLEEPIPDNARNTTPAKASASAVQENQGSSHTRILELGNGTGDSLRPDKAKALPSTLVGVLPPRRVSSLSLKPTVTRRQRASISFKHKPTADEDEVATPSQPLFSPKEESPLDPRTGSSRTSPQPRDWLTGDENLPPTPTNSSNSEMPILRRSPGKRASVIEKSGILISEGIAAQPEQGSAMVQGNEPASTVEISPTIAKFAQLFPPIETAGQGLLAEPRKTTTVEELDSSSSSADEGPEDANGSTVAAKLRPLNRNSRRQTRQSSVHDLVDLWGGTSQHSKDTAQSNTGDDKVLRRRQRNFEPPPESKETPTSKVRNSSPELKTPIYLEPAKQPINIDSRRQVASGRTSPSPTGRPRPHSLFLFPSKSADSSFQQSNLLDAPPDAKRLQNRRNSITDMVERYEAMGVNSAPTGLNSRSPSPLVVKSTTGDRRTPLDVHKTDMPEVRGMNTTETGMPRSRKLSLKPHENPKPPVSLQALLAADDRKEKSAVSDRSPSTERAYKGVGKLIDQWQRKAEEAEPGRTAVGAKRISIITKRPAAAVGKPQ